MAKEDLGRGDLVWAGEHWINYIRPRGGVENTGMVSLYHAYFSPAGRGTVAYVDIPGEEAITGVYTDSREFGQFIDRKMIRGNPYAKKNPWIRELPWHDSRFNQSGDIRHDPTWTIAAENAEITTSWRALQPAIVGPPTIHEYIIFTIFFFADRASIQVDGRTVPGAPYPNEAWAQNLGEPHSSCVFALAETMIEAD